MEANEHKKLELLHLTGHLVKMLIDLSTIFFIPNGINIFEKAIERKFNGKS
jgi:hypothetical protein